MKFYRFILFFLGIAVMSSCIRENFDEPNVVNDPSIAADKIISLEEVLNLRVTGKITKINLDKYIQAIVVADDESGNFYKTIVVEDEKSDYGITVLIDENELNTIYKIGRRVFINLKDLYIGDYAGLPQIGYGIVLNNNKEELASIPGIIMKEVVIPGVFDVNNIVKPREVTMSQLGLTYLNTLVKIKDVQFENPEDTYTDAASTSASNRNIMTCSNQSIVLRTSAFADFAKTKVGAGKGSIAAIYTIFNTTKQMILRNPADVDMTGGRCGTSTGDEPRIAIKDLRKLHTGSNTVVPKAYIQGVVISDNTNKNINSKNVVIQDGDAGIVVRFVADNTLKVGEQVKVVVSDIELSEFNGLLQLNNVPNASGTSIGNGTITPKEITIDQILKNLNTYESTLVVIKQGEFASSPATYSGNLNLTDASGTITHRTASTASFASTAVKKGKVDVTAIVSEFTPAGGSVTAQIGVRSPTDIAGDGTGGTGGTGSLMTIESLKSKYAGTKTTAPDGWIEGVVISDNTTSNITAKNFVIQDGKFGIVVRLTADNTIALGKRVKIVTNGVELSEFNKLLQLNNVPEANVSVIGDGILPTPLEITISDLKAKFETYESTLVLIKNATISGGTTMAGTLKIDDSTGTIDLFTRSTATFGAAAVPSGSKSITGIVSEFTSAATPGYQLNLRGLGDIK